MPVTIRDARNSPQDRNWIQRRYPEYLEDLSRSSLNTGTFPASGEYGERRSELMARWFADEGAHPLIIVNEDRPAGFALVSRPRHLSERFDYRMSEFFVTAGQRRRGVGRDAAQLIFNRFAGAWEIGELPNNKPAVAFWRAIVADYTGGRFRESLVHGEVRQVFNSAEARRRR